jgi:hypothetical protein
MLNNRNNKHKKKNGNGRKVNGWKNATDGQSGRMRK